MQNIFIELINEELNLIETSFYIIKNIYDSPKFTIYDAFLDIVKKESYITRENLKSFFIENGIELDDDDIYMMMFRIDSDDDNRISYVEFQKIFYPLKDLEKYNNNNLINNEKNNTYIGNSNLKEDKLNSDSKNIIYDITSTPKVLKQNKDQSNYSDYKGLMNENSKNNQIYKKLGKIDESEDIIKKTERKYSQGFTDYTTERKKDTSSKKNL
jgi:HD superfamily phosphohydrolase